MSKFATYKRKSSHSIASFKVLKTSTYDSWRTPTLLNALPLGLSAVTPQNTSTTPFATSRRLIRTKASAADISTPTTRDKSTTTKRTGLRCQSGPSTIFRKVSSTWVMVPKKRNPECQNQLPLQDKRIFTYPGDETLLSALRPLGCTPYVPQAVSQWKLPSPRHRKRVCSFSANSVSQRRNLSKSINTVH